MREISLHILDLLENAVEAGATRIEIRIEEDLEKDWLFIEILDNGCGMSRELIGKVLDPFYTTRKTRHVGLGLPLLLDASHRCEGDLVIQSEPGEGTQVKASFRHSHIDRAPIGDMSTALVAILLSERPVDLDYCHKIDSQEFRFDSSEVRRELEDVPLTHPRVRDWLLRILHEGETGLFSKKEGSIYSQKRDRIEEGR